MDSVPGRNDGLARLVEPGLRWHAVRDSVGPGSHAISGHLVLCSGAAPGDLGDPAHLERAARRFPAAAAIELQASARAGHSLGTAVRSDPHHDLRRARIDDAGRVEEQGFTYALADGPDKKDQSRAEQLDSQNNEARREALARLNRALSLYAQKHEGRFPLRDDVPEISEVLWRIPDYPSMHYIYIPGLKRDLGPYVLAYEPGILGPNRWVLLTDGTVRQMTLPQIRHAIAPSPDTSDRPIKAEAREKR